MYYLLLDGVQAGPFTLVQLVEMWRDRRVNTLTLYWEEGNVDWLPLHNIAPLLEMPDRPAPVPSAAPVAATPPVLPTTSTPMTRPGAMSDEKPLLSQHPSLWHWTGELIWGVILTPILIGIPILIHVFCARGSTTYRVTRSRVSVETGIFTRSSRELRIVDIRSIAARKNVFGLGDIEFSTAARDDAEVVFRGMSGVERARDLVKQLQNDVR